MQRGNKLNQTRPWTLAAPMLDTHAKRKQTQPNTSLDIDRGNSQQNLFVIIGHYSYYLAEKLFFMRRSQRGFLFLWKNFTSTPSVPYHLEIDEVVVDKGGRRFDFLCNRTDCTARAAQREWFSFGVCLLRSCNPDPPPFSSNNLLPFGGEPASD